MTLERNPLLTSLFIASLCLLLIGCSEDDPAAPNDDPAYPAATHPDTLMANFIRAYEAMDEDAYADMLSTDYIFDPVNEGGYWGFPEGWDRATELDIAHNMFSGLPGEDPDGIPRPGIQSISINALTRVAEWAPVTPDETVYNNAQYALFDASITFYLEGGENTMSVYYDQVFFIREATGKATDQMVYQLVGHREIQSYDKGTENNSWSVIKSIYMSQPD